MSLFRRHSRLALVALSCVALGAGASAIASAGAATGSAPHAARAAAHGYGLKGRGLRWARRAVHAQLVVPTAHGFVNVTIDRGKLDSVSGNQITISEGTATQTYRTVTVSVPTGATVRDNRQPSSLSALAPGQRVIIISAPQRTWVIAHTPRSG